MTRPPPKILGILNITTDSFSDGGLYLTEEKAQTHGAKLIKDGAEILDIGAASSHPDSHGVSAEEEKKRLAPVLKEFLRKGVPVSVDSFLPQTQRYAMREGASFLNDIQGFADASLYGEIAENGCGLIVMHSIQARGRATREPPPAGRIEEVVWRFFDRRLEALTRAGIKEERLIVDPGMGFFLGNSAEASVRMLSRIDEMKARYGLPVLVSVSRKSFLQKITGRAAGMTGAATLAAEIYAALHGADYIRTHDPAPLRDAILVLEALQRSGTR